MEVYRSSDRPKSQILIAKTMRATEIHVLLLKAVPWPQFPIRSF